jgi:hypothetical protein
VVERVAHNPFYVLELPASATRAEIERAGQRWLGLLGVQSEAAGRYRTPLGEQPRDADAVRVALARLRDPRERLLWELWVSEPAVGAAGLGAGGYEDAARLIGWHSPWRSR